MAPPACWRATSPSHPRRQSAARRALRRVSLAADRGPATSFQSFAYDPDGSVAAQRWDLDGDGDFDEDVTGPSAFTTFTTPGERVVRLQVRDNEGALQTATVDVDVRPAEVVRPSALGLLTPFPIIRLAGSVAVRGTHVRLLEVRAPRRSLVTVRCDGPNCPEKPLRKRAKGSGCASWRCSACSSRTPGLGRGEQERRDREVHALEDPAHEGAQAHRPLPVPGGRRARCPGA